LWIPKWLGEIYSSLYLNFETTPFTYREAKTLEKDSNKLSVAFSKLHSERILTIFEETRPRIYRLIDPITFVSVLATDRVKNHKKIPQERYLPIILQIFREISKSINLNAFAVYGSVSRGTAGKTSDIDILLISKDFKGSIGERLEELLTVQFKLQAENEILSEQGIHTQLSFYPLKQEEAERKPSLFLDLTEDAIILYDEDNFLETILLEYKAKLLRMGAKRIFLDGDKWYWDLKPDYRFGEVIEIP
jgi:hypothetical protein